jgi:hypothetical protein
MDNCQDVDQNRSFRPKPSPGHFECNAEVTTTIRPKVLTKSTLEAHACYALKVARLQSENVGNTVMLLTIEFISICLAYVQHLILRPVAWF